MDKKVRVMHPPSHVNRYPMAIIGLWRISRHSRCHTITQ